MAVNCQALLVSQVPCAARSYLLVSVYIRLHPLGLYSSIACFRLGSMAAQGETSAAPSTGSQISQQYHYQLRQEDVKQKVNTVMNVSRSEILTT